MRGLVLLLLLAGCQATPIKATPPKPIPFDARAFSDCCTGPRRDTPLWGYRVLDEEHTMKDAQAYFSRCGPMDRDADGDLDLRDFAIWARIEK